MTYDTNETATPQGIGISGREAEGKVPANGATQSWGDRLSVSSYLDRCQVDTPVGVVQSAWNRVRELRPGKVGKVVDLGAGDGRFATYGLYESYVGYEIDQNRSANARFAGERPAIELLCFLGLRSRRGRVYRESTVCAESTDPR